jgi:hypothetical protein
MWIKGKKYLLTPDNTIDKLIRSLEAGLVPPLAVPVSR